MPLKGNTTDVLEHIHGRFHSLPFVSNTAPQLRFSHLVGYGARYYSYLYARSVASAIWQKSFQDDPFSASAGKRLVVRIVEKFLLTYSWAHAGICPGGVNFFFVGPDQ